MAVGIVLLDPLDQLVLPHHGRLARACFGAAFPARHEIGRARHRDPRAGAGSASAADRSASAPSKPQGSAGEKA